MVSNAEFFADDKQAAAVFKHAILSGYLPAFAGATGSTSLEHKVGFLDGYAGAGEYVNTTSGRTQPGSPRIALDIAERIKNIDLVCVFVEKQRKSFEPLNAMANASITAPSVLHGDIRDHLDFALRKFDGMPLLVFLDPFGAALDTDLAVEKILKRPGDSPTELLLNFSMQALRRMGGRIYEDATAKGREATLETADRWLGGEWWREIFLSPEILTLDRAARAGVAAERTATEYAKRIVNATGGGVFPVPVRRKPRAKAIFRLMLFFQRNNALYKYNNAVSLAIERWQMFVNDIDLAEAEIEDSKFPLLVGPSRVDELKSVFAADKRELHREAIDEIKASIKKSLGTAGSLHTRRDFANVFGKALGVGRETHLRSAWKELATEGVVTACPTGKLENQTITRVAHVTF